MHWKCADKLLELLLPIACLLGFDVVVFFFPKGFSLFGKL